MGVRVAIEPAVIAAMGGPVQARAMVAGLKPGRYKCVVCHQYGHLGGDEAASLIVRIFADSGPTFVVFAHPTCSGSRVERYAELPQGDDASVQAIGWVEPAERDPRAVVLVAPIVRVVGSTPTGDASDRLIGYLHAAGYAPVADMAAPLPVMDGLVAYHTPAALVIREPTGADFYDGPPVGDSTWARTAAAQGRIRVLFATGLRLDNPDRDPHADLFTAISRGHVVGAVARYVAGPPPTATPPSAQ